MKLGRRMDGYRKLCLAMKMYLSATEFKGRV